MPIQKITAVTTVLHFLVTASLPNEVFGRDLSLNEAFWSIFAVAGRSGRDGVGARCRGYRGSVPIDSEVSKVILSFLTYLTVFYV